MTNIKPLSKDDPRVRFMEMMCDDKGIKIVDEPLIQPTKAGEGK